MDKEPLIIKSDLPIVINTLNRLRARFCGDLSPLMEKIGFIVSENTRDRVKDDKTTPDGKPWAALKPATIAAKERRKTAHKGILMDNEDLLGNISYKAGDKWALIGTNAEHGEYLQTGTKKMPAREFLGLSNKDREKVSEWIGEKLRDWWYGR